MTKKVIAQVLPSLYSGGVERGTLDIAQALVENDYQAIVISSGGPMVEQLLSKGALHIELPVHSKNPLIIWQNQFRLARIIRRYGIDLLHVRSRAPAWSCIGASRMTNIPLVTTFHGTYGHTRALKRWYNSSMLRGDTTIAVSGFIKEHIEQHYVPYAKKIDIVHRGIDMDLFSAKDPAYTANSVAKLKSELGLPSDKTIILLPARLTRWKGHLLLLEALSRIDCSDIHLLVVGDEPGKDAYRAEILASAKKAGLGERMTLTGHKSDMTTVYCLADIVVSASTKPEAFGRIACEAQALERIIVAPAHGGSLETIAPDIRHLMYEPENAESFSIALKRALSLSKAEREALGPELREYIDQHFSLAKMCNSTLQLYEKTLSARQVNE